MTRAHWKLGRLRPVLLFALILACRLPGSAAAMQADGASLRIVVEREACFGPCPVYRLTIEGSGAVTFEGRSEVLVTGIVRSRIDPARVAALAERFRAANFHGLRDSYLGGSTDGAIQRLTFADGARVKTVVHYYGEETGMPVAVEELQSWSTSRRGGPLDRRRRRHRPEPARAGLGLPFAEFGRHAGARGRDGAGRRRSRSARGGRAGDGRGPRDDRDRGRRPRLELRFLAASRLGRRFGMGRSGLPAAARHGRGVQRQCPDPGRPGSVPVRRERRARHIAQGGDDDALRGHPAMLRAGDDPLPARRRRRSQSRRRPWQCRPPLCGDARGGANAGRGRRERQCAQRSKTRPRQW